MSLKIFIVTILLSTNAFAQRERSGAPLKNESDWRRAAEGVKDEALLMPAEMEVVAEFLKGDLDCDWNGSPLKLTIAGCTADGTNQMCLGAATCTGEIKGTTRVLNFVDVYCASNACDDATKCIRDLTFEAYIPDAKLDPNTPRTLKQKGTK